MIDLTVLPSRLPPVQSDSQQLQVQRLALKHADMLSVAGQQSAAHVRPWLGNTLCPVTPAASKQCITGMESQREQGYGITYLLIDDDQCLGMGLINYIHPVHLSANLGFWLRPDACGRGLATALCRSLIKLGFSQMGLHRLECLVEPANKASLRVVTRLGAEKEGVCRKRVFGRDALLYSIT
ncbi:GNAT family N-acetyltransferase [Alteromonas halophila]|uniref:N-acetyltransferase n=1 Tax=Alteromonas halophila TaxID=516698 RepID=A0A918JR34_9ALTE|nr:GNAT family protein [Alteromonas halophila]GGW94897.1 N-acetyltransferase [Alteromonas halophila]